MHKKLAADLTSLAHSILQMKNKEDVFALKEKAYEVYEKLSVLAYVEEYINNTPNPEHTKEELIEKIEQAAEKKEATIQEPKPAEEVVVHNLEDVVEEVQEELEELVEEPEEEVVLADPENVDTVEATTEPEAPTEEALKEVSEEKPEEVVEEPVAELEEEPATIELDLDVKPLKEVPEAAIETKEDSVTEPEEAKEEEEPLIEVIAEPEPIEEKKAPSLDDELKDTISVDVVADLFENATKKSLNDKLHGDIQIGLNDRIAFVKNLFGGSQEDFNRVVSQLNTFKTEKEAKKFLNKMVKPDYNWSDKEEYEERFMAIVERKFA
jgi:hypothetical protein